MKTKKICSPTELCSKPEHWHEQKIMVTVITQFPQSAENMEQMIRQLLGHWCSSAEVVSLNVLMD